MSVLTGHQPTIAELVAVGWSDKGIAIKLGIDEETVGYHVGQIAKKWDLDRTLNIRVQITRRMLRVA